MTELLQKIKQEALADHVPIMSDESLAFIVVSLLTHRCKSLLEIGTAVGVSALAIAHEIPDIRITTLERDELRYNKARSNILECHADDRIRAICTDALTYTCIEMFDALIIDAAKAQNKAFFDRFFPFVKPRGIVIVDNLDFHGHSENIENLGDRRNLRQMVNKIKNFESTITSRSDLAVERVSIGDGMMLIRRIGHSFNFNE
jgi:predicted O-methyltransferase YrrM